MSGSIVSSNDHITHQSHHRAYCTINVSIFSIQSWDGTSATEPKLFVSAPAPVFMKFRLQGPAPALITASYCEQIFFIPRNHIHFSKFLDLVMKVLFM